MSYFLIQDDTISWTFYDLPYPPTIIVLYLYSLYPFLATWSAG